VLCIFSNTSGANTRQFALRKIPFSAEIRIPPEQLSPEQPLQRAVELRRRSLILLRCPLEPPLAEMALRRGPPAVSYLLLEQIALWEILLLEEI
jgi:hypothetical protein